MGPLYFRAIFVPEKRPGRFSPRSLCLYDIFSFDASGEWRIWGQMRQIVVTNVKKLMVAGCDIGLDLLCESTRSDGFKCRQNRLEKIWTLES